MGIWFPFFLSLFVKVIAEHVNWVARAEFLWIHYLLMRWFNVLCIQIGCEARTHTHAKKKWRDKIHRSRFGAGNSIITIKCCFKSMIKVKYQPLKPKIDSHRKIRLKSRTVRTNKQTIDVVVVIKNPEIFLCFAVCWWCLFMPISSFFLRSLSLAHPTDC